MEETISSLWTTVYEYKEHADVIWRHLPTQDNHVDLSSKGGLVTEESRLWWMGPD